MKILALLDDRPGNDNQTIAIAEHLGDFTTLKIEFSFWARLPNFLLGKSLIGVKTPLLDDTDIVIASGRKLARVAAHLKSKTGCKAVQLMHPQMNLKNFDLVFVPEHDQLLPKGNLHTTFGAPNRINAALLEKHHGKFPDGINIALIGDVDEAEIAALQKISNLYISTSRRTKPETIAALKALHPAYIYEWIADGENPYYGLLAAAKNIVVSADSVGMISEACTTGKNVYIFGTAKKHKFRKFIARLICEGYAKPIEDFGSAWQPEKLTARDYVVQLCKRFLN